MTSSQTLTETEPPKEIIAEKPSERWRRDSAMSIPTPETQSVLLLHGAKQAYQLTEETPVPELRSEDEVLLQTKVIGLNPIDWKAP